MILDNSERGKVLLSVNRRRFAVSALSASSLTRNRRLRCGLSDPYAFSWIAVARLLVIFFFLALAGCGFGDLRRVESLLLEVLDRCPRADPAGANIVACGDSFAWLGCKGDLMDTKSSTLGDRVDGFGLSGKNIGTKDSADCDRDDVPAAGAEVDSVVVVGILEGV